MACVNPLTVDVVAVVEDDDCQIARVHRRVSIRDFPYLGPAGEAARSDRLQRGDTRPPRAAIDFGLAAAIRGDYLLQKRIAGIKADSRYKAPINGSYRTFPDKPPATPQTLNTARIKGLSRQEGQIPPKPRRVDPAAQETAPVAG